MVVNVLQQSVDIETYAAGETIFSLGDPGETMYVVLEGEVDIIVHKQTIDTVTQGGIMGEMAIIDAYPRSATAIAKTNARVVPINQEQFVALIREKPGFALQVMRVMVERLRYMNTQV